MNPTVIEGASGVPSPPDWESIYSDPLDQAAAAEAWREIVAAMTSASTIAAANGDMIARLIRFRVEFSRAARDVAERGCVKKQAAR